MREAGFRKQSGLLLAVAMVLCMLCFMPVRTRAAGDYSLVFHDRPAVTEETCESIKVYPEFFNQGEKITILDHGISRDFTYRYFEFYDKDWKTLQDYGYNICHIWEDDSLDLDNAEQYIGRIIYYRYILYRVDDAGKPLDEEGKVTDDPRKAQRYCATDKLGLKVTPDYIETTVNHVLYYVYAGKNTATVIYQDYKHKGSVKVEKSVTINGKTYPVTVIDAKAFEDQSDLTQILLPETITEIGGDAFLNTGIKSIYIPDSVEDISTYAFGYAGSNSIEGLSYKKVPGFSIYTWDCPAAEQYAVENDMKLINKKAAGKIKVKITSKKLKKKKVSLKWKKTRYVDGFEIYEKKPGGKYKKVATIKDGNATGWTGKKITSVKKGNKIYYKVRSFTKFGDKKAYGKWSAVCSVKVN